MTFNELSKLIFEPLAKRIESEKSLGIFARGRSKFEGWLKVAVCSLLVEGGIENVIPEQDRIDVKCDGWAIELKTTNTSYRYSNVITKTKTITKNIQGIINDIEALRASTNLVGTKKAVLFVVFPVTHDKLDWQEHLAKVKESLGSNIVHHSFKFNNGIDGMIYLGQDNEIAKTIYLSKILNHLQRNDLSKYLNYVDLRFNDLVYLGFKEDILPEKENI